MVSNVHLSSGRSFVVDASREDVLRACQKAHEREESAVELALFDALDEPLRRVSILLPEIHAVEDYNV